MTDRLAGRALEAYGEWLQPLVEALLAACRPGDVVVDVGAGWGALTLAFARRVGRSGEVLAIEPDRMLHSLLCANGVANDLPQIRTHALALGDEARTMYLPVRSFEQEADHGLTTLCPQGGPGREPVLLRRLDDFQLRRLDLLKIHACGHERAVLEGGRATLLRLRPRIAVVADDPVAAPAVADWLAGIGYRVAPLRVPLFNPANFYANLTNHFGEQATAYWLAVPGD